MKITFSTKVRILVFLLFCFSIHSISAQTETIYIDFGSIGTNESASPWNNVTNNVSGTINNLINSNSLETGIGFSIIDGFTGINVVGTQSADPGLNFLESATRDSFYGTTSDSSSLIFNNLVIGKQYTISIFASRTGVSDNRETSYTIEAQSTQTVYLDATENTSNVATASFYPKADGTIVINVSTGPNNDNGSGFFYLGVIELEYSVDAPIYSDNALLIDFGSNTNQSSTPWNNLTDPFISGNIINLINKGGNTTAIDISVTDAFNYFNEDGTTAPGTSLGLPITATGDSFFGNTTEFIGKTEPTGAVEFSDLNPNNALNITIYASRLDYAVPDNKETQYVIEGLTTETLFLDIANNHNNTVSTSISPKADGTIKITASPGPNNTNINGFFYLGAVVMEYTPQPTLSLNSPNGGEFWQVGKTPEIMWDSTDLSSDIDLEYSTDNGASWNPIATVSYLTNSYNWTIPNTPSENCLVRATSDAISDTSNGVFEISSDDTSCNIVVIGSSTAEGIGASSPEFAWVNLYAKALFQKNTRINVINYGKGGYTTYHLLPTGTPIPGGVGVTIDTERNITKAISDQPIAIIVNLPSNDTANGYPVADQLNNFATLYNEAVTNTIPIWITTTQPRNFGSPTQIQDQIDVRDGIISTYGTNSIDFWTNVAETDGTILSQLDYGDGVHLNNLGHNILFNKVLGKDIENADCISNLPVGAYLYCNDSWKNDNMPSLTTGTIDVFIGKGTYIINADENVVVNDLNVSLNGSIIIEEGGSITVNGNLINNGNLTLESISNKYSSLIVEGTSTGNVNYNRHINNAAGANTTTSSNDLISAPVTGQSFGDFRSENSNIPSGTINGDPAFLFGTYNPATGNYVYYSPNEDSNILSAGIGYVSGSSDGSDFTFVGNVETSSINASIVSGGVNDWNLIGNPYPSYLNAQDFLNNLSNSGLIDESAIGIYGYDGSALDGWSILNLATTNASTIIAPGQGFFVNAETSGDIVFTPSMRRVGNDDDFIQGRNANPLTYLKLKINSSNKEYHTDFYFNDHASLGLDPGYDAKIWDATPPNFSLYSHLLQDNVGSPIALQAFNSNDVSDLIIPLGVHANANESLSFSILESTLPNTINLYLEDNLNNEVTLLNNSEYIINPLEQISGTGRFYLRLESNQLNISEQPLEKLIIYANQTNNTIAVIGQLQNQTHYKLYDVNGRIIISNTLDSAQTRQFIDISQLTSGMYIIELTESETQIKRAKKLIIQ
ncbi:GDSL-type esterase/lipase family protein [Psychroserpens damuponensis]|uniref:GDSL-type esterase/lipase family protein n=1 Tax=Psychroserpens damuponensis TaxID=943936 RepID=UPI000590A530|nr:GDSL-type esterase/lipase family protein [Psychroserpens damuponensis]